MVESEPIEQTEKPKPKGKMDLRLVVYPDEALRDKVHGFATGQINTKLIRNTAGAMIRSMYKMGGIGLAAQQVGAPGAMFVLDTQWHQSGRKVPKIFLNPVMLEFDGGTVEIGGRGEGCLSTPYGYFASVPRAEKVRLEWLDLKGEKHDEWFDGVEAIAIQHEIDHLHGVLFVDRLSRLKQDIFKRKARKARRQYTKGYKKMMHEMKMAAITEKRIEKAKARGAERKARIHRSVEAAQRAARIMETQQ
jgi:peptide deformylase